MTIETVISRTTALLALVLVLWVGHVSASEVTGTMTAGQPTTTPATASSQSSGSGGGNGPPVGTYSGGGGSIVPTFGFGGSIVPTVGDDYNKQIMAQNAANGGSGASGGGVSSGNATGRSGASARLSQASGGSSDSDLAADVGTTTITTSSTTVFAPTTIDDNSADASATNTQYASVLAALGAGDLQTWIWTLLLLALLVVIGVYLFGSRTPAYDDRGRM